MIKTSRALLLLATLLAGSAMAQGMQVPKPSAGLMPNPNIGKPLFDTHCASCHGADLEGSDKGPHAAQGLSASHHSDMAFQMAVKNGSRAHHWNFGDMKPVEGVTADEVAHITAYVRMQQRKAGIR